jgi:thioredoxin-related protein
MKRLSLSIFTVLILINGLLAQSTETQKKKKIYDPSADAKLEIANAVKKAEKEGKHVFLQIGGNWCIWCIAFDSKVKSNDTLGMAMENNFIVYHLNYSKENKNMDVLASLGFPQRFGFPVFVILDAKGNRLHTQNSEYLEEGKGHSTSKILEFLKDWSPTAMDAKQYAD